MYHMWVQADLVLPASSQHADGLSKNSSEDPIENIRRPGMEKRSSEPQQMTRYYMALLIHQRCEQ